MSSPSLNSKNNTFTTPSDDAESMPVWTVGSVQTLRWNTTWSSLKLGFQARDARVLVRLTSKDRDTSWRDCINSRALQTQNSTQKDPTDGP